ncbi:MAG: hypothetical protein RL386_2115 [Bacteroidota bacterium]
MGETRRYDFRYGRIIRIAAGKRLHYLSVKSSWLLRLFLSTAGSLFVWLKSHIWHHPRKRLYFLVSLPLLLGYVFCLPKKLFDAPFSTVIEDQSGRLLGARIAGDGQWRFPEPDSLPEKYVRALVAFEDQRFFYHPGVDPLAFGRAVLQNLRGRRVISGGSTLSMQVVRLSRKGKSRNIPEKIIEVILATRLELRYPKKRILHFYAAQAPFGGNVVGIEAAAWRYFGKPPHFLSWAEAALLAILPNSPALIHPGRNREALRLKRNRLLKKLHQRGKIDALSLDLALSEPLPDAPLPLPALAPHLLQRVAATKPGQRFKTSISADLQQKAIEVSARNHLVLKFNEIHNLAALIVHVPSGRVLAYIGNAPNTGAAHGQEVDIVTAPRSTGSILKPILFALAVQEGSILPSSLLPDVPMNINGYHPENFQRDYDGMAPADKALSRSLNVPFVHLLRQYGVGRLHYQLHKLGISTVTKGPDHYGLSLILGGAEATLWDIGGVYTSMARTLLTFNSHNSRYRKNDFRPLDFLQNHPVPERPDAFLRKAPRFDAGTLWHTFEAMQELGRPESEGDWQYFSSSRRIAWKTGTSFGFRDAWAIGLTPEYLVATWVGNADGVGRPGLIGTRVAAPFMFELFGLLPASGWFQKPYDGLRKSPVCRESGWPAGRFCPADTVLLPAKSALAPDCRFHTLIHLDPGRNFQVSASCQPAETILHESWFVLPTLEEFYYRKKHPAYQPLPPLRPECAQGAVQYDGANSPMQLIYPSRNARIYIPKDLDGNLSATVFKLAHRNPDTRVFWHLDKIYLGSTQTFHHFELRPSAGHHVLTLVDTDGNQLERSFFIVEK